MKIIHCADLHLNSKIDSLPTEKSRIVREEIIRNFEKLCSYANINGVSVVIIAGDLFDTVKVSSKIKERVLHAISSCNNTDFLYLRGNHDNDDVFSESVLPDNLKLFSDTWKSYRYGNVVISGLNFNGKNDTFFYETLNLSEDDVNIVVLHGQVIGYKSNEQIESVSIPKLKEKHIDYLALGHIHSYDLNKVDNRGVYAYSGALSGRGFDETGEKGYILLDIIDNKIVSKFQGFSDRKFYEYNFDLSSYSSWFDIRNDVLKNLKEKYDNNSVIKVVLQGEHDTDMEIDVDGLISYLNEYFFFVKVYDKTELKINYADFENDKSMRGEFVRAVLNSDLGAEDKKAVIICGIKALKGDK